MRVLFLLIASCILHMGVMAQGSTTSSIRGQITEQGQGGLLASNVTAIHVPSGTFYGSSSDDDGFYRIDNMRIGGPYKITYSFIGLEETVIDNVFLRLGEPFIKNVELGQSAIQIDEITVTAKSGSVGKNSGSSTQISSEDIEAIPTLNRDLADFTKLTPQSSGSSFAGVNNRFNAIFVDGAVNNDVFGLADSGTNGGQTGISPFSIDIIDQIQVVLSPYDVTFGGFAGGGINAVTKSGTNKFKGTAYWFHQNESLVGKTNGTEADRLGLNERTGVAEFNKNTYGASLGGPLAKDKAFFFVNAEIQKDVTPIPFNVETYTREDNRASVSDLEALSTFLQNTYNYDPGTFGPTSDELDGLKLFAKLDINLSNTSKLTLRHNYTKAEQFNRNGGNAGRINFSNNGIFFPSVTNSSALELNTSVGNTLSNNLIIGYTTVNDDRGSLGQDFPFVIIDDGNGSIRFGTEPFSTGNVLNQKVFTITDNLKLYKGKHTWTFGTHNEFYDIRNIFLPWNFGQYEYNSLDDFISGAPADDYRRVYSLVDNITGDGTAAAAEFNAIQLGFYVQDQIQVNNKLNITAGLRLDIPVITTDPEEAPRFNTEVLPRLAAEYELANNIRAGSAPSGQLMFSPRLGFEYSIDRTATLRGGVGIFTSRIPFVWPGAMFNTNGLTSTFLDAFGIPGDIEFRPDIQNQYVFENPTTPSGDLNLFTEDFRYPQVFRGNIAYDKTFAGGWQTSFEALYTKTLNNITYSNLNTSSEVDFTWTGSGDNRPVFVRSEIDEDDFGAVYVGSNTSDGYTYNLTGSVSKQFASGFNLYAAYSFSDARAGSEGTSSQNSSGWRGQVHINGRNEPVFGRSDFAVGSRIISSLGYNINWGGSGNHSTNISLFYEGQSGQAFSYVIGNRNGQNINNQRGSTSTNRSLVYVPSGPSDINLVDFTVGGTVVTAAQQWENLNALIEDDPSLSSRRGQYAEKNGSRDPFSTQIDLAIKHNVGAKFGDNLHKLQFSLDIFNFPNLISNSWGTNFTVPGDFSNYFLYEFEGYADDGTTPTFTYRDEDLGNDRFNIAPLSSRWRMRVGVRYIFD